jgi:hypothetical protein
MIGSNRASLIRALVVGDIFHAEAPNGASLICLTTDVSDSFSDARTVTTQQRLRFDRTTGVAELGKERVPCPIDSVAPLPLDIHNVILGLDRKSRLTHRVEHVKLNDAEINALLFVDSYYAENPLPEV